MLVLKTIIALIVFALGLFSYLEGISQLHKKEIKSNEYQVWFYQLEINLKKRFPEQDGRLNLLNKVTVVLNFLLIISLGIFVSGIYIINKTPDVSLIIWGMWSGLILMIMSLIFRNQYYRLYKKTIDWSSNNVCIRYFDCGSIIVLFIYVFITIKRGI